MRQSFLFSLLALMILASCSKQSSSAEDQINGTWIREGTTGTGSGNTLTFSVVNGKNTLSFDCSGSPGPGWPSNANTEYKFVNGKLSYLNYYDNTQGFYNTTSFNWLIPGEEFEIKFREILLFMSADYTVKYRKVH